MENKINSKEFVKEQYQNADNLNARINLHKYNVNKVDWNNWFFERMNIPEYSKVLELGCGNGLLWKVNEKEIKKTWDITLSDISEGMLESAKQNIGRRNVDYQIIDIQDIPFVDECFDAVIARHMLYHVPDIDRALSEVKRVLKHGGKFFTSTNGSEHMQELKELVNGFAGDINYDPQKFIDKFDIESGGNVLEKHFDKVTFEEFNGQIVVDKAEPVAAYAMSSGNVQRYLNDKGKVDEFYKYVETEIAKVGEFKIRTSTGMFTAIKE